MGEGKRKWERGKGRRKKEKGKGKGERGKGKGERRKGKGKGEKEKEGRRIQDVGTFGCFLICLQLMEDFIGADGV
jgi:hypothetical protein